MRLREWFIFGEHPVTGLVDVSDGEGDVLQGVTLDVAIAAIYRQGVLVKLQGMTPADRKLVLDDAAEFMCLLCGEDAPCFCAPGYDE